MHMNLMDEYFQLPAVDGPTPSVAPTTPPPPLLLLTSKLICSLLKASLLGQISVPIPYPAATLLEALVIGVVVVRVVFDADASFTS